jgi:hypothetical protein
MVLRCTPMGIDQTVLWDITQDILYQNGGTTLDSFL